MNIETNFEHQPEAIKDTGKKIKSAARTARHNGGMLRDEVFRVVNEVVAEHNREMANLALVDQRLICGTGGSHVWVSRDDDEKERIIIIT